MFACYKNCTGIKFNGKQGTKNLILALQTDLAIRENEKVIIRIGLSIATGTRTEKN